jgi:mobilome CxxCx(11)CxxC protein
MPEGKNIPPELQTLKAAAWNKALESSGTAYIFEVRARRLGKRLNYLNFLGLAVPLNVGAIVLAYGTKAIPICSAIGVFQLVVFGWSLVAKWVDRYQHSVQALVSNRSLAQKYESLAKEEPAGLLDYRHRLDVLDATDSAQRAEDYQQEIREAETRMGMHAGLRQYERECAGCHITPIRMEPTECGVCGDFPKRWVR